MGKSKLAAFDAAGDISSTPIRLPGSCARAASGHDVMNSRFHPCKQTRFSARLIAKCKRRHLRTYSKMTELMALAAGLPTIFRDREDIAAGGLASYRLYQCGPDDE